MEGLKRIQRLFSLEEEFFCAACLDKKQRKARRASGTPARKLIQSRVQDSPIQRSKRKATIKSSIETPSAVTTVNSAVKKSSRHTREPPAMEPPATVIKEIKTPKPAPTPLMAADSARKRRNSGISNSVNGKKKKGRSPKAAESVRPKPRTSKRDDMPFGGKLKSDQADTSKFCPHAEDLELFERAKVFSKVLRLLS